MKLENLLNKEISKHNFIETFIFKNSKFTTSILFYLASYLSLNSMTKNLDNKKLTTLKKIVLPISSAFVGLYTSNFLKKKIEFNTIRAELNKIINDELNIGFFLKDQNCKYITCNEIFANIYSESIKSITGKRDNDIDSLSLNQILNYENSDYKVLVEKEDSNYIEDIKIKDDNIKTFNVNRKLVTIMGESYILGTMTDITSQSVNYNKILQGLNDELNKDNLTNLFSRKFYNEELTKLVNEYNSNEIGVRSKPFSMILLDLDQLKVINDKLGHGAGDYVLKEIAYILKETTRDFDIPFRFGGDEFGIILTYSNLEQSIKTAKRIQDEITKLSKDFQNNPINTEKLNIAVSMGISEYSKNLDKGNFFDKIDDLLYQAKKSGRNRIKY